MWCVFVSPCRGVLHTPDRRPIYGANDPNNRSLIRILVPCGAILWGVCHTPLLCYPKNTLPLGHSMRKEVQNAAPCRHLTAWYGAAHVHGDLFYLGRVEG